MGPTARLEGRARGRERRARARHRAARGDRGARVPTGPLRSSAALEAVHALVRGVVAAHGQDRPLAPEIEALAGARPARCAVAERATRSGAAGGARVTRRPASCARPRGTRLSCRSWQQEAALRMLMNNLDPEVAERPEELVVYGGIGKAARNWECFDAIVRELAALGRRRDAARAVGQAGRRLPHPPRRAARADRQLDPGARAGRPGSTSTSSSARA